MNLYFPKFIIDSRISKKQILITFCQDTKALFRENYIFILVRAGQDKPFHFRPGNSFLTNHINSPV